MPNDVTRDTALEMLKKGELTKDEFPIEINWFITGKGGCLKTTSAAYFFQYKYDLYSGAVSGIDLDQANASFFQYGVRQPIYHIEKLNVFDDERIQVEPRRFDLIVHKIEDSLESIVIDNGSSTFQQLMGYLKKTGIMYRWEEFNYRHNFHCPIIGVDSLGYCLKDIEFIVESFQDISNINFYLWLHKNHGELEVQGKAIQNTDSMLVVAEKMGDNLHWIDMPKFDSMSNPDIQIMLKNNLSFESTQTVEIQKGGKSGYAVKVSPWGLDSVQRTRLKRAKIEIFRAIREAGL